MIRACVLDEVSQVSREFPDSFSGYSGYVVCLERATHAYAFEISISSFVVLTHYVHDTTLSLSQNSTMRIHLKRSTVGTLQGVASLAARRGTRAQSPRHGRHARRESREPDPHKPNVPTRGAKFRWVSRVVETVSGGDNGECSGEPHIVRVV